MLNRRHMALKVTEQDDWDIVWTSSNVLDSTVWNTPITGNASAEVTASGVRLYAADVTSYAGIRYKNYSEFIGVKAKYEVEILITSSGRNNGIRMLIPEGTNGVSSGRGIQLAIHNNSLIVHTSATTNLDVSNKQSDIPVNYGNWNKLTLSLDTASNKNEIFLNDVLVCTQKNDELNRVYLTSWWVTAQSGDVTVRAIRYKKYM